MRDSAQERFEEFVGTIAAIEKEIQRIRAAECAKIGLRGADLMVVYQLGRAKAGLTGAELARRARLSRAAVSRSIANLENEGLVVVGEAAPEDGVEDAGTSPDEGASGGRYRTPVRLTQLGEGLVVEAEQSIARVMARVDSALGDDERSRLYVSLDAILDRLRKISR